MSQPYSIRAYRNYFDSDGIPLHSTIEFEIFGRDVPTIVGHSRGESINAVARMVQEGFDRGIVRDLSRCTVSVVVCHEDGTTSDPF